MYSKTTLFHGDYLETLYESLQKMCCKPYFLIVIDTALASYNPLRFRTNLLEIFFKLIMTADDRIRTHDSNGDAAKILAYYHQVKLINMSIL